MPGSGTDTGETYWDLVSAQHDALPAGWRRHARNAHLALVREWVGEPVGRWLKTDLFEERDPARALLPQLPAASWTAIDVSAATALGARRTTPTAAGTVLAADVRSLPFVGGSFDGVLSTSTLDHFDDVASLHRSLGELHRVLRPGGLLVLTLDNPGNPLVRLRNALPHDVARRTGLVPFAVGRTLDDRAGGRALRSAGFEVLHTTHLLHAPHVLATRPARYAWWERRALPWFDRLAGTRAARVSGHFVAFLAEA